MLMIDWKEGALQLAETTGVIEVVRRYTTLACESFSIVGPAAVRAAADPETGEEYLAFDITVSGSVEDVLTSLKHFRTAVVKSLPMDKLYHLRLSYNLDFPDSKSSSAVCTPGERGTNHKTESF